MHIFHRSTLFIALIGLLSVQVAGAAPPTATRAFAGINLGAAGTTAVDLYGKPTEVSSDFQLPMEVAPWGAAVYTICPEASLILMIGKISPMEARILQVTATGTPCDKTSTLKIDGIGLGSPEADVIAKFGEPNKVSAAAKGAPRTIGYNNSNVSFGLLDGKVMAISVRYLNSMIAEGLVADQKMKPEAAWMAVADMRRRGGQVDLAFEAYEQVLKLNPKSVPALLGKGTIHLVKRQLSEADASFKAVIAIEPKNAIATHSLGRVALQNKDEGEARRLFQKTLTLDAKNAAAWMDIGLMDEKAGKLDDAQKSFTKAADLAPALSQPHQGLGRVLLKKEKKAAAIEAFSKALVLERDNPAPNRNLIAVLEATLVELRGKGAEAATTPPAPGPGS